MKILNIILALYVTLLSCLPCADVETDVIEHTSVRVAANHDNHSHNKKDDMCSPFCICNCCGQQTLSLVSEQIYVFSKSYQEIKSAVPDYKSVFYSDFYGSIWQPPQIV